MDNALDLGVFSESLINLGVDFNFLSPNLGYLTSFN